MIRCRLPLCRGGGNFYIFFRASPTRSASTSTPAAEALAMGMSMRDSSRRENAVGAHSAPDTSASAREESATAPRRAPSFGNHSVRLPAADCKSAPSRRKSVVTHCATMSASTRSSRRKIRMHRIITKNG